MGAKSLDTEGQPREASRQAVQRGGVGLSPAGSRGATGAVMFRAHLELSGTEGGSRMGSGLLEGCLLPSWPHSSSPAISRGCIGMSLRGQW